MDTEYITVCFLCTKYFDLLINLYVMVEHGVWWSLFRILCRCDVKLYQQMGGHRDELSLHERSLDLLVGLLKEEMVSCICLSVSVCVTCVCVCVTCACVCVCDTYYKLTDLPIVNLQ